MNTEEYETLIFNIRLLAILIVVNMFLLIFSWTDQCVSTYNNFIKEKVDSLNCNKLMNITQEARPIEQID